MPLNFDIDGAVHLTGVYDSRIIEFISRAAQDIVAELPSFDRPKLPIRDILVDGVPADRALMTPPILDVARHYLGHEPEPSGISNVRRMLPDGKALPFHQDETLLGHKLVNVWIPLTACGVDAPGLQIVRGSWGKLWETASIADSRLIVERQYIPADGVLSAYPPEAFYQGEYVPGDAMIFSGRTIHRTHQVPAMTRPRFSVELRLK